MQHIQIEYEVKVCFHDVSRRKPFAHKYLKAMQSFGLKPASTYILGDRTIDIQAAHSAKMISGACNCGTNEIDLLRNSRSNYNFETVTDAFDFF